jgi:hypothetical protein
MPIPTSAVQLQPGCWLVRLSRYFAMANARVMLGVYLCADTSVCGHAKGLPDQLTTHTVIYLTMTGFALIRELKCDHIAKRRTLLLNLSLVV